MNGLVKRILLLICGFMIVGISIGMMKFLNLGIDPFGVMLQGISDLSGLSFGTLVMIAQIILFIPVVLKRRDLIGIGTIVGIFGIGYIIEFFGIMWHNLIQVELTLPIKIVILVISLIVLAFGAALNIVANLGVVVYDALHLVVEDVTIKKISFKWSRMGCDAICTIAGFLLGATVGIATLATVFMIGPFITYFKTKLGNILNLNGEFAKQGSN